MGSGLWLSWKTDAFETSPRFESSQAQILDIPTVYCKEKDAGNGHSRAMGVKLLGLTTQPRPHFYLFSFFSKTKFTEKTLSFSWIRTWIVGVEGKNTDHLTTTIAHYYGTFPAQ